MGNTRAMTLAQQQQQKSKSSSGSINFTELPDLKKQSQPRANEIDRKEKETGLNRMGRDDDDDENPQPTKEEEEEKKTL